MSEPKLSYTAADVIVAFHQAYVLAWEDMIKDLGRAADMAELRTMAEASLAQAKRSLAMTLSVASNIDTLG